MKILIVDDEELTRTGVISSVDWDALGIDQILQADDGVHGLETALLEQPEIILCDVRMPRMDGITMLEQISKYLPETTVLFMSGYSDKEYLKAAIKLKAINYIEKPISKAEIESSLREAVKLHEKKLHSTRGEALHSRESGSHLAHLLAEPGAIHIEEIRALMEELSLPEDECRHALTILVQLDTATDPGRLFLEEVLSDLQALPYSGPVHLLSETRRHQYLVFTFLSKDPLSESEEERILLCLKRHLARFAHFYITLGESHEGLSRAHLSYEEAVILMQYCYFFESGTVLSSTRLNAFASTPSEAALPSETEFYELLNSGTAEAAEELLQKLFDRFHHNCSCLPNQAKDLYYKFFYSLEDARIQNQILSKSDGDIVVSMVEMCFSFDELHHELFNRTQAYYRDLGDQAQENPTILLIKDYISQNFSKETLSVKEISEYVYLSTSYVCTFFKNETGKTLNQYITDFRMEKAKQLLDDPRYKISDVSARVGYSDGNYFGKSFKKHTGVSPSEFRERKSL